MNKYANRGEKERNLPAAEHFHKAQPGNGAAFQFVDHRSQTASQRKLQQIADSSLKVKQLMQLQTISDGGMQSHQAAQFKVIQAIQSGTVGTGTIELASGKTYSGAATLNDHDKPDSQPTYMDCGSGTWPTRIDVKKPPKGKGPISAVRFTSPKGNYTFNNLNYFAHGAWEGPRIRE